MFTSNIPLHPAQYEIYIDQLIKIESPHYNIGLYIQLKGDLNVAKFIEAVSALPTHFDAFKLRFNEKGTNPICFFDESYTQSVVAQMDFTDRLNPTQDAKNWIQDRFNTPFLINKKESIVEHVLIKIASDEHWFFLRYHQIIIDSYGFTILLNHLSNKYQSLIRGDHFSCKYPLYKEAAIKAAAYRNSPDYEADAEYWKNKISNKPQTLLRKNSSIINKTEKKSGNYYLSINSEKRYAIDEVIRETKSNLQQLTIAALIIYFGETSNQSEMIFGLSSDKRNSVELRSIVGAFSGILPFKGVFEKEIILTNLLKAITISSNSDYNHENFLMIDLVRSLKIKATESSLYDISINHIPFDFELDFGENIKPTIQWMQSEFEKLPLQVVWRDFGNKQPLELALHFRFEYFSVEEIELFAARLIFILEQFPLVLHKNIGNIHILPLKEQKLLNSFCGSQSSHNKSFSIIDLFQQQVKIAPNAIALIFKEVRLSYQELNERSNQLAHYLRGKGVQQETLVPICIERGIEMMVCIWGILKAGGAYVPIDPEYPAERIQFMLEDTAATIVIITNQSKEKIQFLKNITIVSIDEDAAAIARESSTNLPSIITPETLAYVIYTSGSTGKPKGVMIDHGALLNYLLNNKAKYITEEKETSGSFVHLSYTFDASLTALFMPLLAGKLIVVSSKLAVNIFEDENLPLFAPYDFIKLTPAHIPLLQHKMLLEDRRLLTNKLVVGGEALHAGHFGYFIKEGINVEIINEYGPTEATVGCSVYSMHTGRGKENLENGISIGKPIDNVQIFILSQSNQVVPIGVAGEICIGGAGLARGYLNKPGLTAEKFVSISFTDQPALRLYKTGDLAKWLPNGNIAYLRRIDDQVKIKGYRIEPGEIESVLLKSGLVKQAVVVAKNEKDGEKRLVGFIITEQNNLDREALNNYLACKLPRHMIPSIWLELTQFPLTSNGKIDRNALPQVNIQEILKKQYQAPRNQMEKNLCTIWQELFKVEKIGINDNFFELGGDSIISIQVVSHAKSLGYTIEPTDLFLYQTIGKLSTAKIKQTGHFDVVGKDEEESDFVLERSNNIRSLIPAKKGDPKLPLYIVCGGGGTVYTFKKFIEMLDADQQVYVLQQPIGKEDLATFPVEIKGIASRYVSEIITQNPVGPYALSGHCIGGIVAFEMAKQLEVMGKKVELLAMFDTILDERTEKPDRSTLRNLYDPSPIIKNIISKLFFKIQFESFLLRKHTKQALLYKLNKVKSFVMKNFFYKKYLKENFQLLIYNEQGDTFEKAYRNYKLTDYNKDVIVFYAKDHYIFLDKNNNISYKKYYLSHNVKDRWKSFVQSVTFYEIEGEHSTMFDPEFGGKELALKLQEHLNKLKN